MSDRDRSRSRDRDRRDRSADPRDKGRDRNRSRRDSSDRRDDRRRRRDSRDRSDRRDSRDRGRDNRGRRDSRDRDRDRRDSGRDNHRDRDGRKDRDRDRSGERERRPSPPRERRQSPQRADPSSQKKDVPDWVRDLVEEPKPPPPGPEPPRTNPGQRTLVVPQQFVSKVLGFGGCTVNEIQLKTKTYIKMDQSTRAQGYSTAMISSTLFNDQEALEAAEAMIKERIDTGMQAQSNFSKGWGKTAAPAVGQSAPNMIAPDIPGWPATPSLAQPSQFMSGSAL